MAHPTKDIQELIRQSVRTHALLEQGVSRVALAVSGGADSVCLLHAMAGLRREFGIDLCVAHLNHGVRGAQADEDQKFVRSLAGEHGLAIYTETIPVPSLVEPGGPSLEQVCREQRMDFYERALDKLDAQRMATGHTLSDQADTVLMRVLRGTSLRGLAAMQFKSGHIIRPLLAAPREIVRACVAQNNLPFREDETNTDERYTRNRLRHSLMPVIKNIFNPQAEQRIFALAQLLRTDCDFLENQAQLAYQKARTARIGEEIHLDCGELALLHKAVLSRVLILAYYKMAAQGPSRTLQQQHIVAMMQCVTQGRTGCVIELPGRFVLEKAYGTMVFRPAASRQQDTDFEHPLDTERISGLITGATAGPETVTCAPPGVALEFATAHESREQIRNNRDRNTVYFDADRLQGPMVLRSARPGDRFYPLGMAVEKKLQDFFTDKKIPRNTRQQVPLLVCGRDIVWVAPHRIDHRYRVRENTRNVLKATIRWCSARTAPE